MSGQHSSREKPSCENNHYISFFPVLYTRWSCCSIQLQHITKRLSMCWVSGGFTWTQCVGFQWVCKRYWVPVNIPFTTIGREKKRVQLQFRAKEVFLPGGEVSLSCRWTVKRESLVVYKNMWIQPVLVFTLFFCKFEFTSSPQIHGQYEATIPSNS